MTDKMGCSITVEDWHLAVHEDNIRFWVSYARSFQQIVESFLAIPHRTHGKPEFSDCLQSDLLVDSTASGKSAKWFMDIKEHPRGYYNILVLNDQDMNTLTVDFLL